MKNDLNRDLLVLLNRQMLTDQAFEQEVESLNKMLVQAEVPDAFCTVHELVRRNRITQKKSKILNACKHVHLPPFYFLLNKN